MAHCRPALIVAVLAVCAAPIFAANIVQNGSFENPQIGNWFRTVYAGDPFITGWTVGLVSVDVTQGDIGQAEDGTQGIDMAGSPGPGSLTQTLTTESGAGYMLSFWVSSNGGPYTDALIVDWNGFSLATLSTPAPGTWREYSFEVTGTGSDTLAFIGTIDGLAGARLDNVSVDPIPEPATLGLIGAGWVLIGFRFRRR